MVEFKDHFSGHAAAYAAFRPGYPSALFAFLATLTASQRVAWDAATGNGQAAIELAKTFSHVIATDASPQQIANAPAHPRVEYQVSPVEESGIASGTIDLVTVAQALHWFDFARFYQEVGRVLAPGGAIAVWTYNLARSTPRIDAVTDRLARQIVGPYWPPERRWVDEDYRTIPFPFVPLPVPEIEHRELWDLPRLLHYFGTWSACQRYLRATGEDPVALVAADLASAWGDGEKRREIAWPLSLRAGRVP